MYNMKIKNSDDAEHAAGVMNIRMSEGVKDPENDFIVYIVVKFQFLFFAKANKIVKNPFYNQDFCKCFAYFRFLYYEN